MKKVIISIVLMSIAILIVYSMIFYHGVYISKGNPEDSTVVFMTKDKRILHNDESGRAEDFVIKGVNVDTFIPGHSPSEYYIDEETWLRWFGEISDMGANTIRTFRIYNDTFYNAFYKFNQDRNEPLYLLQGIQVNEYAGNNCYDAYSEDFYYQLYDETEMAVDVIHGRRNIPDTDTRGFGKFRKDVSPWVIGYIVGTDWNPFTIEYTNNNGYDESYEGNYLSTENADAFETMLCKLMDHMVYYEADKYHEKRLITFVNDPLCDPLDYDEDYAVLYGKFCTLDAEHIIQNKEKYSGFFASYNVDTLCQDYNEALSLETKQKLRSVLSRLEGKDVYLNGYVDILCAYHTVPVVISSYECSTSRGVTESHRPVNEKDQGEILMESYRHMRHVGCCGAFIECWQDSWVKRSFNTTYALDLTHTQNWQDPQTVSQSKGIMAFVPENEYGNVYIDGDFSDFDNAPVVISDENSGYEVKSSYDTNYIYFYIKSNTDIIYNKTYLVFDITPKSGSLTYHMRGLEFDSPVDFILCFDGYRRTRMYVQRRYDSLRENYLESLSKEDPFEVVPEKNSDDFVSLGMLWQRDIDMEEVLKSDKELLYYIRYDSGRMVYGNNNPDSKFFNSLADFCYGDNGVEVRIPWTLLNFSDPSRKLVHDDYYENYGRDNLKVESIKVGIGDNANNNIELKPIQLSTWKSDIKYEERMKASYDIIKENWGQK